MQQKDNAPIIVDHKEEIKRTEAHRQYFRPPPLRRMNASLNIYDKNKRMVTRVVQIRKSYSIKTSL